MKNIDLNYFPGWTRKSISFTIDDGNVRLDRKFMDIVKPAGIKGTFNLTTPLRHMEDKNMYVDFYRGYEIANHCRYHAYPFADGKEYDIKNESFDRETADRACVYPTAEEGIYRIYTYNWCYLADDDRYMECVASCQAELEELFGKGKIKGYIWPCGEQPNASVFSRLKNCGFQNIRKTGCVKDSTGFALPADRTRWSYNADYRCMTETAELFEKYPDDGTLKWFCFGVHSHDFENAGRWDVLIDFCEKYGNRPEDFWYASVGDVMTYEDAVKSVIGSADAVINPSDTDLCVKIDGRRVTLGAGEKISLGNI
ncbi:MAG: polysaccharide deacetylase family protein [Clostridia bacterium]|nr:polysaccharide deacetylase family protein [Clostridia bacterium]